MTIYSYYNIPLTDKLQFSTSNSVNVLLCWRLLAITNIPSSQIKFWLTSNFLNEGLPVKIM